jgi:hypothetical protein
MTEYEKLFTYLDYIYKLENVLTTYGYVCYFKDYIEIANLIPKDKIVVDVGCGFGVQQVLFRDHKGYIGIQKFKEGRNCDPGALVDLKSLTDNATLMQGLLCDIWDKIGITEENKNQYFGIANHSLWHDPSDNAKDIEIFKSLFPTNYYATNETERIKY